MRRPKLEDFREGLIPLERNFERNPFFVTNKSKEKRARLILKETIEVDEDRSFESLWTVEGSAEFGLPGAFDQDVFVGFGCLLDEQGGPDERGKLWYKPYRVLKLIGVHTGKREYDELALSVERVADTKVKSVKAFHSARLGRRVSKRGFSLWEYELAEHMGRRGSNLELSAVRFCDLFLENYERGYIDRLDASFYRSLSTPTAKRMFRLLNERCDHGGSWSVPAILLRDLVPLAQGYDARMVKARLGSALSELTGRGFLDGVIWTGRGPATTATFSLSAGFGRRRVVDAVLQDPRGRYAFELLTSYRMGGEDAALNIKMHGADRCIEVGEELPHQKNVRSPVGWLVKALSEGYEFKAKRSSDPSGAGGPRARSAGLGGGGKGDAGRETLLRGEGRESDQTAPRSHRTEAESAWASLVGEFLASVVEEGTDAGTFRVFEGVLLKGDVLVIRAPDKVSADELSGEYGAALSRIWRARRGETARLAVGPPEEVEALSRAWSVEEPDTAKTSGTSGVEDGYERLFGEDV